MESPARSGCAAPPHFHAHPAHLPPPPQRVSDVLDEEIAKASGQVDKLSTALKQAQSNMDHAVNIIVDTAHGAPGKAGVRGEAGDAGDQGRQVFIRSRLLVIR